MNRLLPRIFSLALIALSALLLACGGGDGSSVPDGDGESDDGFADGDREQTEREIDTDTEGEGCRAGECPFGRYCDETDGLCKTCTEDLHCGTPDEENGITPVCLDGVCERLTCGFPLYPDPPADGVDLPLSPLNPTFDSRRILFVKGEPVFPLGVQGVEESHFPEAKAAGFNVIVGTLPCCSGVDEEETQTAFIRAIGNAGFYAAVPPVWPPAQINSAPLQLTNSISERANSLPLLFWLGSDRAEENGYGDQVEGIADFVHFADATKPFAVAEVAEDLEPVVGDGKQLYIPMFEPDDTSPAPEIKRMLDQTDGKPVWARFDADENEDRLYARCLHALAAGATGILFEMPAGFSSSDEKWQMVGRVSRTLRDYTAYWISPSSTEIRLEGDSPDLALFTVRYNEKITVAILANVSGSSQEVTLTLSSESNPFCFFGVGEGERLDICRQKTHAVSLQPYEVREFHLTNPGKAGDEVSSFRSNR